MKKLAVYYGFHIVIGVASFWPLIAIPLIIAWLRDWQLSWSWTGYLIAGTIAGWATWHLLVRLLTRRPKPPKGALGT
ncbi:hypothetical protein KW801_01355 [Candidatus Saccharibacteria bacterium]|nr:hypothetical protein [Candidatus Saccharibacteria bacterium]